MIKVRLIDADALVRELKSIKVTFGSGNGLIEGGLEIAISTANSQPTIEPERKKGKWQITDAYPHNVYCSECHKRFAQTHWAVWEDGSLPRNFCPNCGSYNGGNQEGRA